MAQNTQNFSPPSLCNYRRVWHPCHTHATSQGVQWSPLHQPSCQCILPQNSQNPQKPLAEISSHRLHRGTQIFLTEISSHRCHRCSQIFLTEIFSHGLHRTRRILVHPVCAIVGGYGILPYPRRHQTIFPEKPQNLTQHNHLWASAKSVGGSSTLEISVNSVNSVGGLAEGGVGMAGMPYPPNLWASAKSVGEYSSPVVSVGSANSVGGLAEGGVGGVSKLPYSKKITKP